MRTGAGEAEGEVEREVEREREGGVVWSELGRGGVGGGGSNDGVRTARA